MKSLWKFMCLAGGATLFGLGCGAPPRGDDGQICWPALGVYSGPSTGYSQVGTMYHGLGNTFDTDSQVFSANGDGWVRGYGFSYANNALHYGYVRWNGLCH